MAEWNINREGLRGIARRLRGLGIYRPSASIEGERLADLLKDFHGPAYTRAMEQDADALQRNRAEVRP